ncbi:hypothetical protein BDQ17DRAFT_1042229 [Cyathus striatus]|nr:hypothetical protein BDQ17DRAFT_1042229 [Cyathus striatus]
MYSRSTSVGQLSWNVLTNEPNPPSVSLLYPFFIIPQAPSIASREDQEWRLGFTVVIPCSTLSRGGREGHRLRNRSYVYRFLILLYSLFFFFLVSYFTSCMILCGHGSAHIFPYSWLSETGRNHGIDGGRSSPLRLSCCTCSLGNCIYLWGGVETVFVLTP